MAPLADAPVSSGETTSFHLAHFSAQHGPDKSAHAGARLLHGARPQGTMSRCLLLVRNPLLGAEVCTSADSDPGRRREPWPDAAPPMLLLTHCNCWARLEWAS